MAGGLSLVFTCSESNVYQSIVESLQPLSQDEKFSGMHKELRERVYRVFRNSVIVANSPAVFD